MSIFKKPAVAILLAIILIITSTTLFTGLKLKKQCDSITSGFYNGVRYHGEILPPIEKQLNELCAISENLIIIANNYGIYTNELSESSQALKDSIKDRESIDSIYDEYSVFSSSLRTVLDSLHETGLSERHSSLLMDYSQQISSCLDLIDNSQYNETVSSFRQSFGKFPAKALLAFYGINYPQYFS